MVQRMYFTCKVHFSIILIFLLKVLNFFFFLILLYICIEKLSFHFLPSWLSIGCWIRSSLWYMVIVILVLLTILFFHSFFFHLLVHFESFRIWIIKDTSHIGFVITWIIESVSSHPLNIMGILCSLYSTAVVCYKDFSWTSHFEINRTLNSSWSSLWFFLLRIICENGILSGCFWLCPSLGFAFI